MSAEQASVDMAIIAAHGAMRKKAVEVIALDVSERLVLTDIFVIATGSNQRQVRAIVDSVDESMSKAGFKRIRREGFSQARWVLLDYGAVIVHVQHDEDRQYYALERLWADAAVIEIPPMPEDQIGEEDEQEVGGSSYEPMSAAELVAEYFGDIDQLDSDQRTDLA